MKKALNLGYYSHSKQIFNTEIEKLEYSYLSNIFNGHIICPNIHLGKLVSFKSYLGIVKKVDYLFVTEFNGFLGKASFEECTLALQKNIPLFVIKKNSTEMWIEKVTEINKINEYNLLEHGFLKSKKISSKKLAFKKT